MTNGNWRGLDKGDVKHLCRHCAGALRLINAVISAPMGKRITSEQRHTILTDLRFHCVDEIRRSVRHLDPEYLPRMERDLRALGIALEPRHVRTQDIMDSLHVIRAAVIQLCHRLESNNMLERCLAADDDTYNWFHLRPSTRPPYWDRN